MAKKGKSKSKGKGKGKGCPPTKTPKQLRTKTRLA